MAPRPKLGGPKIVKGAAISDQLASLNGGSEGEGEGEGEAEGEGEGEAEGGEGRDGGEGQGEDDGKDGGEGKGEDEGKGRDAQPDWSHITSVDTFD